jgi:hypothetical protein
MNSLLAVNDIRFSQNSISPPDLWDATKYRTMDVVETAVGGHVVTLDDRRLYRAKMVVGLDHLAVNKYKFDAPINDSTYKNRFRFSMLFHNNSKTYVIDLVPKLYGSALIARCGLQSSHFNLDGSSDLPNIGTRRSTHKRKGDCDESEGTNLKRHQLSEILGYLRGKDSLYAFLGEECPMIMNVNLRNLFSQIEVDHLCALFDVKKIVEYDYHIEIVAMGEAKGEHVADDDQLNELLFARECELLYERERVDDANKGL